MIVVWQGEGWGPNQCILHEKKSNIFFPSVCVCVFPPWMQLLCIVYEHPITIVGPGDESSCSMQWLVGSHGRTNSARRRFAVRKLDERPDAQVSTRVEHAAIQVCLGRSRIPDCLEEARTHVPCHIHIEGVTTKNLIVFFNKLATCGGTVHIMFLQYKARSLRLKMYEWLNEWMNDGRWLKDPCHMNRGARVVDCVGIRETNETAWSDLAAVATLSPRVKWAGQRKRFVCKSMCKHLQNWVVLLLV